MRNAILRNHLKCLVYLDLYRVTLSSRAPSLFVAVSKAKMSRQTTLGRFGFKKSIAHGNSVMEMKVPDFVSTMSRTIVQFRIRLDR